jgi:hypothetical protein
MAMQFSAVVAFSGVVLPGGASRSAPCISAANFLLMWPYNAALVCSLPSAGRTIDNETGGLV